MKIRSKRVLAVFTTTALLTGLGVAAFGVDDAKEVRQADFITGLTDVRTSGHYEFLEEGLHVFTDDNTSLAKVALYFAPRSGTDLPTSYSQEWYGTAPEPGKQIVFDTDGDRANAGSFNILVGEPVYGAEWWLTGPGGDGQARAAANGYTCPETTGGTGSNCHGTLAQWKAQLATDKPDTEVYAYGFSLGSGIKGDGVLRAQNVDGDEYIFTDEENPAPVTPVTPEAHTQSAAVTAAATWNNSNRVARINMNSASQPANDTGTGTKVRWEIYIAGTRYYMATDGWGDTTTWAYKFGTEGGSVKVELRRNGVSYATRYITTN